MATPQRKIAPCSDCSADTPAPLTLCGEIAEEVRDMAISLFLGQLSPDVFEKTLVALESAKLRRFGFRLTVQRLENNGSRFRLTNASTGHVCATLDFDSASKNLQIEHLPG